MKNKNSITGQVETTRLLLRSGIAFSFIYAAVAAFFDPLSWIGFFPSFLLKIFPADAIFMLYMFSISEILIAIWILVGQNTRIPSMLASIYLALIIISNFQLMDIVFRDISILAMTLALATLERNKSSQT